MICNASEDLVTQREAANLLGLHIVSFRRHQQAGRISRINSNRGMGIKAFYRREDVLSLVPYLQVSQHEALRQKTTRTCRRCNQELPVSAFWKYTRANGKRDLMSRCKQCGVANHRFHERIKRVITDGKTSPICRQHGFSIARNAEGVYRAARMDKQLSPGESALVRYEFHYNVWCVLPVPVRVPDSDRITEWCRNYEARLKTKTGRSA